MGKSPPRHRAHCFVVGCIDDDLTNYLHCYATHSGTAWNPNETGGHLALLRAISRPYVLEKIHIAFSYEARKLHLIGHIGMKHGCAAYKLVLGDSPFPSPEVELATVWRDIQLAMNQASSYIVDEIGLQTGEFTVQGKIVRLRAVADYWRVEPVHPPPSIKQAIPLTRYSGLDPQVF